jgi:hypothetical protein
MLWFSMLTCKHSCVSLGKRVGGRCACATAHLGLARHPMRRISVALQQLMQVARAKARVPGHCD